MAWLLLNISCSFRSVWYNTLPQSRIWG